MRVPLLACTAAPRSEAPLHALCSAKQRCGRVPARTAGEGPASATLASTWRRRPHAVSHRARRLRPPPPAWARRGSPGLPPIGLQLPTVKDVAHQVERVRLDLRRGGAVSWLPAAGGAVTRARSQQPRRARTVCRKSSRVSACDCGVPRCRSEMNTLRKRSAWPRCAAPGGAACARAPAGCAAAALRLRVRLRAGWCASWCASAPRWRAVRHRSSSMLLCARTPCQARAMSRQGRLLLSREYTIDRDNPHWLCGERENTSCLGTSTTTNSTVFKSVSENNKMVQSL
jgi:hypothetical protein